MAAASTCESQLQKKKEMLKDPYTCAECMRGVLLLLRFSYVFQAILEQRIFDALAVFFYFLSYVTSSLCCDTFLMLL